MTAQTGRVTDVSSPQVAGLSFQTRKEMSSAWSSGALKRPLRCRAPRRLQTDGTGWIEFASRLMSEFPLLKSPSDLAGRELRIGISHVMEPG